MAKTKSPLVVMKVFLMLTLLGMTSFSFLPAARAAYSVPWRFVQHRLVEGSSTPVYRAAFALKDSGTGEYVTDGSIVANVVLRDPSGNVVNLTNPAGFEVYFEEDASYNGTTYTTTAPLYTASDFSATPPGPLVTGTYTFQISLNDASTLTPTYQFNGEIDLPVISSSSFVVTSDASNLCVQWQGVSSTDWPNTSQRAFIDFSSSGKFVAELFVTVPTDVHQVCIPHSVLTAFASSIGPYDAARFKLQLRTNDNNNRSVSNYYSLDLGFLCSITFPSNSDIFTNPYMSKMKVGSTWEYIGYGSEAGRWWKYTVTGSTTYKNVNCLLVRRDKSTGDYNIIYLAQDSKGNIRRLRELGRDGGQDFDTDLSSCPEIFVPSNPYVGQTWTHGVPGDSSTAVVVSVNAYVDKMSTGQGPFPNCLEVEWQEGAGPSDYDYDYYSPTAGGLVKIVENGDAGGYELSRVSVRAMPWVPLLLGD
jgi:hypothetical protein